MTLTNWRREYFKDLCHGADYPCFNLGKRRRQNTQYVDDSCNWVFLCDECFEVIQGYWADMWAEYYSGCM